ncbi:MAG: hypothetical protein ACR2LR_13165, partial [Hassallia sp.]
VIHLSILDAWILEAMSDIFTLSSKSNKKKRSNFSDRGINYPFYPEQFNYLRILAPIADRWHPTTPESQLYFLFSG